MIDKINYKDKVCVVTGAASGIGLATVKMLLDMEAKVYALDINEVDIPNLITVKVDLSSKESIDNAFEIIPEHIDCFFGVAGLSGAITNYHTTFKVNYIANKYITLEYLNKRMSEGGAICFVTSTAGLHWEKYQKEYQLFTKAQTWEEMVNVLEYQAPENTVGIMAYPLSKRAMNHFMAEAAVSFGEKGIRVNALLPGSTDTGMKKEFEVEAGGYDKLVSHTGVAKRLATPEEMAEPLLFLNSDMARFISGETLVVDYASTAMANIGLVKDEMDIKVGSKLFNLGFMQNKFKKILEPLNTDNENVEDKDLNKSENTENSSENDVVTVSDNSISTSSDIEVSENNEPISMDDDNSLESDEINIKKDDDSLLEDDIAIPKVNEDELDENVLEEDKNNDFTINEEDIKYLNSIDYNSLLKVDNDDANSNDEEVKQENNSDDEIL